MKPRMNTDEHGFLRARTKKIYQRGRTLRLRPDCVGAPLRVSARFRLAPRGRRETLREELVQAGQAFVDAVHGSGVGEAEVGVGAEGFAGDDGDAGVVEQA